MDWSVVFITFPSVDGHTYRLVNVPLMNKLPDVNLNDVFFLQWVFLRFPYPDTCLIPAIFAVFCLTPRLTCSCPCLSLLCYPPFPHSCLFLPCLPGEKVKFRRNWYLLSLFDRLLFIVFYMPFYILLISVFRLTFQIFGQ